MLTVGAEAGGGVGGSVGGVGCDRLDGHGRTRKYVEAGKLSTSFLFIVRSINFLSSQRPLLSACRCYMSSCCLRVVGSYNGTGFSHCVQTQTLTEVLVNPVGSGPASQRPPSSKLK